MALELPCSLITLLLLVQSVPYSTTAQTFANHYLGSFLTAQNNDSFWASSSGDFAFGFQQIGEGGYLLAIWFNKIPEKTVVWSANGNNLAPRGSVVKLTQYGQLVLSHPTGKEIWKADCSGSEVAYAAMLDTGNFVLASQDSASLWQSFDHPTDTILPTNTMDKSSKLVARYAEMNYSNGRFQFTLQSDGDLVLQTRAFPLDSANSGYWWSETVDTGFQVVFNESGSIYVAANDGSILKMISSPAGYLKGFYHRAILEYDGVFRHYVYPKSITTANAGNWSPLQSFIPPNICNAIRQRTGGGACGFNSYCMIGEDQRPSCRCPEGYTFIDPDDVMKGCKQNFLSQSCDKGLPETDVFDFHLMPNTDWPESDYEYFRGQTEDWCREACLGDCFCAAAIYRNDECWKKKIPLSNGRLDVKVAGTALIKIRKGNSTLNPSGADRSTLIFIGSVLLSSSVFLNFLLLVSAFLVVFRFNFWKPKVFQALHQVMPGMNLRSFSYEELQKATNGFKEELGSGAFATVYKGSLEYSDDTIYVAVKRLNNMERHGDQEFKAEVSAIGRTNHRNLVQLLGFCNEGEHRLLVYEFMSYGSVASLLFGSSKPSWYQRMQIALGIARGLFYLHEECRRQIIHCDIKPQNILLDETWTARISDFGIAKLLKIDQTRTMTRIRGTKGYVAPEWFRNMPITVKVDVYSFGIVLLELICCRKNFEVEVEYENQMILADWAYDCYNDGKLDLLVGNDEKALDDMKRVEKYAMIAIWCIQVDPLVRPTMKKVVQMMEGAVEVSVPPDPSLFTSSI